MQRHASPARQARPLLTWVLRNGRHLLTCQAEQRGNTYRVFVYLHGRSARLYEAVFDAGVKALQGHAAIVAKLRDAGWQSVSYS